MISTLNSSKCSHPGSENVMEHKRAEAGSANSHVLGEKAVCLLLDLLHVVTVPAPGGIQHVLPAQDQDGETLLTKL